nr:hypothetical protein [Armatimonas sp.]
MFCGIEYDAISEIDTEEMWKNGRLIETIHIPISSDTAASLFFRITQTGDIPPIYAKQTEGEKFRLYFRGIYVESFAWIISSDVYKEIKNRNMKESDMGVNFITILRGMDAVCNYLGDSNRVRLICGYSP